MRVALALAVVAAGAAACSSFGAADSADGASSNDAGSGAEGGGEDGGLDELDGGEAGPDRRCDPNAPFGGPELVPTLNAAPHHSTSARPAGDFLYFVSDRHVGVQPNFDDVDLYQARFQGDGFTDIRHLTALSTPNVQDVAPTETPDGLTLFFAVGDAASRRIWKATRTAHDQDYSSPQLAGGGTVVTGARAESDPYVVGSRLYFTSTPMSRQTTAFAVYSVDVALTETAKLVAETGSGGASRRYPVVNAAETELYYIEEVGGAPTLFRARRDVPSGLFGQPAAQPSLNVPGNDNFTVSGLSADGCDLYLSARFDAGFNIYRARRGR